MSLTVALAPVMAASSGDSSRVSREMLGLATVPSSELGMRNAADAEDAGADGTEKPGGGEREGTDTVTVTGRAAGKGEATSEGEDEEVADPFKRLNRWTEAVFSVFPDGTAPLIVGGSAGLSGDMETETERMAGSRTGLTDA